MSDLSHASKLKPASSTAPRSGGPRTARGKAHSARNALRHGLSLPVAADPLTAAAVEALTRQILAAPPGEAGAPAERIALAQAVAEAQVDVARIRHVRHDLIAAAFIRGSDTAALAQRLAAINRYERSALWRRKFAIRAFDATRVRPRKSGVL